MHELAVGPGTAGAVRPGVGDLNRRVAGVRPRADSAAVLLDDEVSEIQVLLRAAVDAEERVRCVEVVHVGGRVLPVRRQALEDRPAQVPARPFDDVQVLRGAPADIAQIKDPGIALGGRVCAGAGFPRETVRIPQAERPHPRLRRARIRGVVEGVRAQAVAGLGVDAQGRAALEDGHQFIAHEVAAPAGEQERRVLARAGTTWRLLWAVRRRGLGGG